MHALPSAFFHHVSSASRILCRAAEWRNRRWSWFRRTPRRGCRFRNRRRHDAAEGHVEVRVASMPPGITYMPDGVDHGVA
jgi:hypothetical protein